MNPRWGIVGVGRLGASLVEGLYHTRAPVDICVSPRSASRVEGLASRFAIEVAADNQTVVDSSDHVILAARPDQLEGVAAELRFRSGQVVVSVAAAVRQSSVQEVVGPATAVRAMPVLSAAVANSPTCMYPPNDAGAKFFAHLGPVHPFDDESAFTAAVVAATYYGWVFAMMDRPAKWLQNNGVDADTSCALVAQMTRAAAELSLASRFDLGAMAAEIARPGTFTGVGMELLEARGALQAWGDACQHVLDACRERER